LIWVAVVILVLVIVYAFVGFASWCGELLSVTDDG
jgi:hypothetical protein